MRTEVAGLVDELPLSLRTVVAGFVEDELPEDCPALELPRTEDEPLSDETCFVAPPVTGVTRRCPDETVVPVVLSEEGGVRLVEDAAEPRSSCLPMFLDVVDCEEDDGDVCLAAGGVCLLELEEEV